MRASDVVSRGILALILGVMSALLVDESPAAATQTVFVDGAGFCDGNAPCFTTIQVGVNNATETITDNAVVVVYPGTYPESVNLSLMGSAVGGMPGGITIIRNDLFEQFSTSSTGQPANSAIVAPAGFPADLVPPELIERLEEARQRFDQVSGLLASSVTPANAAGAPVLVNPPAGPGFFNSVAPHPDSVSLVAIDVTAPNGDGVNLSVDDEVQFILGSSSKNGGHGLNLSSVGGSPTVVGAILNMNGGSGALLNAASRGVTVFNTQADMNMGSGLIIDAFENATIVRFPLTLGETAVPSMLSASGNKGNGIDAISSTGEINVSDVNLFGDDLKPTIFVNDNGLNGLLLNADEGIFVSAVSANGNDGNGMVLAASDSVALFGSTANGNKGSGITATTDQTVTFAFVAANANGGTGILATSSGESDFIFGTFGAVFFVVSADDNNLGINMAATGSGVVVLGSTAIGNTTTGIALVVMTGSMSEVRGGIICSNAVGLALFTNASVNAEGNWWGSPSGPFHLMDNPAGTGNPVVDGGSGGGMGDVDFIPWIDTVTASIVDGPPAQVRFQFSGGGGTVFLGVDQFVLVGAAGPGAGSPFLVTTDNGLLVDFDETGPSVTSFINRPMGVLELELMPFQSGPATITLTGPCGLAGSITGNVTVAAAPAPLLSGLGLLAAVATLLGVAAMALRRSGRYARCA